MQVFFPLFQSTLPRGSDVCQPLKKLNFWNFNPRSLAGATKDAYVDAGKAFISIHAPSRERQYVNTVDEKAVAISIHAPSRERLLIPMLTMLLCTFQSTLPRGSDATVAAWRSAELISIHAPSRERRL